MHNNQDAHRRAALTKLELLVLVIVLLVLAACVLALGPICYAPHGGVLLSKSAANQIAVAVNAYYAEYGEWPPLYALSEGCSKERRDIDQWVGDPSMGARVHNNALLFTLRGVGKGPNEKHAANPKRVIFYEGKQALFKDGKPREGVLNRGSNDTVPPPELESCLFDPWGQEYGVILDTTGDGRIDLKGIYVDLGNSPPSKNVGVFSAGKDGRLGTNGDRILRKGTETSDDVVSWQ